MAVLNHYVIFHDRDLTSDGERSDCHMIQNLETCDISWEIQVWSYNLEQSRFDVPVSEMLKQ